MIDHTLLKPDATRRNIEDFAGKRRKFKFATVCVNPDVGRHSARRLWPAAASASVPWSAFRSGRRRPT
jgi:deoxyribose-phosphate aldolase